VLPAEAMDHSRGAMFHDIQDSGELGPQVRAYLHANCSSCHRPGVTSRASLDLRFETPFEETGTCDVRSEIADWTVKGKTILVPGDASKSGMLERVSKRSTWTQMPPLASQVPDAAFV